MTRRRPRALEAGDRMAIVSPASPFSREEFDAGVAEIRRLGFEPVYDETVFARDAYLSGSAALRAEAFTRHWSDPAVAALIAVRGGYGSAQILPLLSVRDIQASPKLFIGYSDNTALLSWLTGACGLPALHGPMLERRLSSGAAGYDESSFMALLTGGRGLVLAPDGMQVLRAGSATGPMFGGTITQLVASLGTPYAFDPPPGCILFLEDVNERPYRLDRMLTQLAQSGILGRAAALVFGEMRGCDEPAVSSAPASSTMETLTARHVIQRFMAHSSGPVILGFPSGHTTGPVWTLPFGVQVTVLSHPHPSIVIEESPVE